MKNKALVTLLVVLAICVSAIVSFAISRGINYTYEGETWYEKVGLAGGMDTGNPGYLAFQSYDGSSTVLTYYLWVDATGDLRIASYSDLSSFASFPMGDWRGGAMGTAGSVVGSQS